MTNSESSNSSISKPGGLLVEPKEAEQNDKFAQEIASSLEETERHVISSITSEEKEARSWHKAREIVTQFRPVPWFIWRISNFVFSKDGQINKVPEGMLLGLRRLLFAAASDEVLGVGQKVNSMRKALEILPSDIIAAISVIHAVARRLSNLPHGRLWRPILDDAILRSELAFYLTEGTNVFGPGKAMLAGFSGRIGLAVLIATGEIEQARAALEKLATGANVAAVGLEMYECDPLQVSAMLLSASGCGRDAAFGTVSYAVKDSDNSLIENEQQRCWLAAFSLTEALRTDRLDEIDRSYWPLLGLEKKEDNQGLLEAVRLLVRQGGSWSWLS